MRVRAVECAKPRVLIFRHELLPWSETFVLNQAESLTSFTPIYMGLTRTNGLETCPERTIILRDQSTKGWVLGQLFRAFRWFPSLVSRLRSLRISLIHAHFEGGGMSMVRLARALQVPLLVTCHGIDVTKTARCQWPNPAVRCLWLLRRRQLQRFGRLFLGVSSFIRERMIGLGYPPDRTQVHYTGVDTSAIRSKSGVREPIVLFVGRLVEKKGCRFAIEAVETRSRATSGNSARRLGRGSVAGGAPV